MRRTSVGNASVKDIPMLDMFLQRLDRSTTGSVSAGKPRHSNQSYNNKSDSKTVASKSSNNSSSSNPNSVSKATCKQATVTASPSP